MMQTLTSIFSTGRTLLEQKLQGLTLPHDSEKIQKIISQELTALIAPKGDFRLSLTVAENAILQHAVGLMNIRHQLSTQMIPENKSNKPEMRAIPITAKPEISGLASIVGSAVGGSVGALIGSWPAVIGAVVGTSVATYYREFMPKQMTNDKTGCQNVPKETPDSIDPHALTDIIHTICQQIDQLIATYRGNISDLRFSYENREKETLSRDYRFLLESIQSVLGCSYSTGNATGIKKLQDRCEQLGESLENYGLRAEVYEESTAAFFEPIFSEQCDSPTTKMPAILEGDKLVLKGKVILPKNKL